MAYQFCKEVIRTEPGRSTRIPDSQISKLTQKGYSPAEARELITQARNYLATHNIRDFSIALDIVCEAHGIKKSGSLFFSNDGKVHKKNISYQAFELLYLDKNFLMTNLRKLLTESRIFNLGHLYVGLAMGDDHTIKSLGELHQFYLGLMDHGRHEEQLNNEEFQRALLAEIAGPQKKDKNQLKSVDAETLKKNINDLLSHRKAENPGTRREEKITKDQIKEGMHGILDGFKGKLINRTNSILK